MSLQPSPAAALANFQMPSNFAMGIHADKLSSPDSLNKRGIDTSYVQAPS